MQGLGDFLFGDFLFWGFFLLFSSIRLSPFVHSPLPPHRIIIRQIRLSAASLHDMPSLACGASLDMVPAPSLANTPAYPSRLAISTACPLRKPSTPTPTPFYPPPLSSLLTPVSSLLIAFRLSLPYPLCFNFREYGDNPQINLHISKFFTIFALD